MNSQHDRRPEPTEHHEYYAGYVSCVPEAPIMGQLESQMNRCRDALANLSDEQANTIHAPYSWTIKQVVGHMIDAEKLFGWRAHRFGCGDETPLPGMEQEPYVDALDYKNFALDDLIQELEACRNANIAFIRRLPNTYWDRIGNADGNDITVRALIYILVGHINHHLAIVEQRIREN